MEYLSIIKLLKNYNNKFNRILLLKCDFMPKNLINEINNLSINTNDFYFNIIRIYFYNYYIDFKKYQEKLDKKQNTINKSLNTNISLNQDIRIQKIEKTTPLDNNEFKYNEDFHIPIEKFMNNYKILYKSEFQKKLFKHIILKIHPDKIKINNRDIHKEEFYNLLCIDVLFWNNENDIVLLYLIATIFGYSKTLTDKDIDQLNRNIAKFIRKRQLIK